MPVFFFFFFLRMHHTLNIFIELIFFSVFFFSRFHWELVEPGAFHCLCMFNVFTTDNTFSSADRAGCRFSDYSHPLCSHEVRLLYLDNSSSCQDITLRDYVSLLSKPSWTGINMHRRWRAPLKGPCCEYVVLIAHCVGHCEKILSPPALHCPEDLQR